ncbi:MAG TPA: metallophosphoesterase [Brevundimonas sp.]|jgi:predicted phosphodiesterase|uniref:metallophosphoesterase family protein n=1 Tax=Brevundimonas sp. TaxID=1871086 RepID=UPI002DE6C315|nr:metallophosphoesterase [Brevundimonas sp.]
MRLAVLSDVHGHARAFDAALTAARTEGFDHMLILGDLLTYGVEPERVMELTAGATARDGAAVILGNHDQIYFDLAEGGSDYADALPDWIRESVDWTRDRVGGSWAAAPWTWLPDWTWGDLYAAHANPYGYGDWTYLSTEAALQAAAEALAARGRRHGVFGHTHRFRTLTAAGVDVVVVGSLGQPRDRQDPCAQWAMLEVGPGGLTVMPRRVEVDWAAHAASIRATTLSDSTKDRLCGFFST